MSKLREYSILNSDEMAAVMLATINGMGEATDTHLRRAVEWATQQRLGAAMLELVLKGEVVLLIGDDGEVSMRFPERESER